MPLRGIETSENDERVIEILEYMADAIVSVTEELKRIENVLEKIGGKILK